MKYSENIFIPLICPIQFLEPREQVFYKKQGYVGSIITDTYIQLFIYRTMYESSEDIRLVMKDSRTRVAINTITLQKRLLLAATYTPPAGVIAAGTYVLAKTGSATYAYRGQWDLGTNYALNEAVLFSGHYYHTTAANVGTVPASIFGVNYGWSLIPSGYSITGATDLILPTEEGFYFVDGTISKGVDTKYVFFEVYQGEELLADSINYCLNPYDDRRIKTITFTHYENDYNAVFKFANSAKTFSLSVDCGFIPNDFQSKTQREDFEQQDMMNDLVSARPYAIEPITFGTSKGIPNWLAHKLNIIFLLSDVKIEGETVTRASGAEMELVERTNNGLGVYKLNLQSFEDSYLPFRIFNNTFKNTFD